MDLMFTVYTKTNRLKMNCSTIKCFFSLNSQRFLYGAAVKRLNLLSSERTNCWFHHANLYHIRFFSKSNKEPDSHLILISKTLAERKARYAKLREATSKKKLQANLGNTLQQKRVSLLNTGRMIQQKGKVIMQDIKETKKKMKEKIEEVVERENIYTIPNLLCVTRIGLSPFLGYLIISEQFEYALVFMALAGISDWFDGWVARHFKSQSSKFGSFLDPMADKVLIGTLFLSLTYVRLIPVALTSLVILKDIILMTSGFVIRYKSLPPPKTLSRYFDASQVTAQLAPTFISKVNTGIQLVLVGSTLAAPVFGYVNHSFLIMMWYITAASTMAAAGSYIFSKKTYKYLRNKNFRK